MLILGDLDHLLLHANIPPGSTRRLIPSLAVRIIMQFVMEPGMVYQYPLWGVGLLIVGLAALGAMVIELAAHQFLSVEFRRRHNDVTAAIFSVVGVTFAALLAFVARLARDGFNKAKPASYAEAARVLDVYNASVGFADPDMSSMRDGIIGYLETVVKVEWPAQAEGRIIDRGAVYPKPPQSVERAKNLTKSKACSTINRRYRHRGVVGEAAAAL